MDKPTFEYDQVFVKQVSNIKRFLELYTMDADFGEEEYKYHADKIGISIDDLRLLYDKDYAIEQTKNNVQAPDAVKNYRKFIAGKQLHRDYMQKNSCVPENKVFKGWRTRQLNRCWLELGFQNSTMVHAPIFFELTKGCSVGCPFYGLSAQKFSSVFDIMRNPPCFGVRF